MIVEGQRRKEREGRREGREGERTKMVERSLVN